MFEWLSELYGRTFEFGDLLTLLAMFGAIISAVIAWFKSIRAKRSEKQAEEYAKNSDEHNKVATEYYKRQIEEINQKKQDIGNSNALIADELEELRDWIKVLRGEDALILNGGTSEAHEELTREQLKEKAYKFICVKTEATSLEIAEYLQINISNAKEILLELNRFDKKIAHSIIHGSEDDDCLWFPKRR